MLIGRETEQQLMGRLVAGARIGQSSVLVLTGEAGIGKTALLEYAAGLTQGMQVLRAAGSESERDVPFGGLLQLLLPALDVIDKIPGPQSEALAVALALREGRTVDRFAVGAATLSLLSRFAEEQPVLLLVDDAHSLDRPSAEALLFVARRLMADRIALLVTSRPEADAPLLDPGLPQVPLDGLSPGSVRKLLAMHADAAVSPDVADRLHRATAGNPLAVVELAGDLDRLERLSPQLPVPVPDRVIGSFRRRAALLSPSAQAALLLAAIADGDLGVVARAVDELETSVADLAEGEAAGLVRFASGRLEFRHPLVRSGVYASASPNLRRSAHRAIAQALPEQDLDRRAWNLCEATVGVDDEVADRVEMVGRRALRRSADAVAATAFERAALLTSEDRARCERFLAAGDAAWLAGQVERAESLLSQAARLASEPGLVADIDGLRGNIALRAGSLEGARDILADAAHRLTATDPDRAVVLLADLVTVCFYLGDATSGLEAAKALDELVVRARTDSARIRGAMAVGIARVLAGEPGIDRIRAAVDDLLALPGWVDDPHRPGWMVLGALFLRESDTGRELVRHAVEDLRERTALGALPNLLFHTARDDATTDRWQSAVTGYGEAIALARETGQTTDLAICLAGLAWLQARTGPEAHCRANAEEAIELGGRRHIHLARAWATFAQGELELGLGRPAEALERFAALDRMLEQIGFLDVDLCPGPETAESLIRLGRRDEACEAAGRYHVRAVAKGQPWAIARAERALAVTAEGGEKTGHFDAALDLHRGSLDVFEEARTRLAYGADLRRHRQRVAARPLLRSALATFERLGAHLWADVAAGELGATGETPHRRGDSGLDLLTPQELQIARILGSGRTTREAAAALFLSPKTVEYHLRHVYTKLSIRSRADLSALLQEALQ